MPKTYTCSICNQTFPKFTDCKIHKAMHSPENMWSFITIIDSTQSTILFDFILAWASNASSVLMMAVTTELTPLQTSHIIARKNMGRALPSLLCLRWQARSTLKGKQVQRRSRVCIPAA
ncbi:uncharacterized protein F5891DRAFT_975747 [Suillus fuscotomentosus]|uniref:C2H2-type domain-containing protein n=1 Tax=Suillus fuscotomentosus TaxID=1912939 RepID=A0AAD4EHT9_9AGAM|nr:uncharacterized protein F5891DRAFT_975747 [Suillus fuscotomentosus]KAG1906347.1 hypothetical protein F5891DRAFT_975747 [Suillus fuscotomentosus]